MAPIFKYAFPIFKYRPDIQIFEYISHYFYIILAFQISNCYSKDSIIISSLVLKESPKRDRSYRKNCNCFQYKIRYDADGEVRSQVQDVQEVIS